MNHAARQAPQGPVHFTPSTRRAPAFYAQPKHLSLAVSLALAALVAHNAAQAQSQQPTPQTPAEEVAAADAKVTQVKVVATRA